MTAGSHLRVTWGRVTDKQLEDALELLVRSSVSEETAKISGPFLVRLVKELLHRRAEERELMAEVKQIMEESNEEARRAPARRRSSRIRRR